jgi:hypothetical protein
MSSSNASEYIQTSIFEKQKFFFFSIDAKTIAAAEIASAKIAGKETPPNDPHKKADAENRGQLSGDQSTCKETPVAPVGATVDNAT